MTKQEQYLYKYKRRDVLFGLPLLLLSIAIEGLACKLGSFATYQVMMDSKAEAVVALREAILGKYNH